VTEHKQTHGKDEKLMSDIT